MSGQTSASGQASASATGTGTATTTTDTTGSSNITKIKSTKSAPPFFILFTGPLLIYCFFTYKLFMDFYDKNFSDIKTLNKIGLLKVVLFCATFFLVYSLIVFEMSKTCKIGSKNFALKAFLYSSVPLVFIFGTIIALTTVLPGWKAPFSNTIGFFIVKNVIERKLFKLQNWIKVNDPNNDTDYSNIKAFNNNHNKTFFINELTPTNFEGALDKLRIGKDKQIDFEGETSDKEPFDTKKALYSAVVLKDLISEFIWLLIGGTLAFSTAHVYSLDHHCGDIMTDENIDDYINTSGL